MTLVEILILCGVASAGALLGFLFGKKAGRKPEARVEVEDPDTESDEPTAPIAPIVEMSRSPHDLHRDLEVGKGIVKRLDMLEAMIKAAEKRGDEESLKQLRLFETELKGLLKNCAFESVEYPSGTPVSTEMRSRIQIVEGNVSGERALVDRTVRCGFLYLHGDEDTMIVRKAEISVR